MKSIKLKNIYQKEVKVTIASNEFDANFITHSGTFHADEVMATCILINMFDDIKLYRTNEVKNKDAISYDIGFGKFDHHQMEFNQKRDNDIKYASCGLIWKEYGMKIIDKLNILNKEEFFKSVDRNIIMDIDRDDNGIEQDVKSNIKQQTIPSIVAAFNPSWNSKKDENECFLEALTTINIIFNNIIDKMISKEEARLIVEQKIEESENNILILDSYMPWKEIVLTSKNEKAKDILYAVFPSKRGGYNIVATPLELNSFSVKKPFPKNWAGLENNKLQEVSGVNTITFCHKGLFICACKTYDDALKIAKIAVNN